MMENVTQELRKKVIDSIIELKPTETLSDLKKRYEETLELLKQVRKNEAAQIRSTVIR